MGCPIVTATGYQKPANQHFELEDKWTGRRDHTAELQGVANTYFGLHHDCFQQGFGLARRLYLTLRIQPLALFNERIQVLEKLKAVSLEDCSNVATRASWLASIDQYYITLCHNDQRQYEVTLALCLVLELVGFLISLSISFDFMTDMNNLLFRVLIPIHE